MSVPDPGWYPDPADPGALARWWDGSDWTDRTRPRGELTDHTPTPDRVAPGARTDEPESAAPARTGRDGRAPALPRPPRSPRTTIVVVTALVALALAVVTVGTVVHRQSVPRAAASSSPPAAPGQGGLEMDTRTATLDGVSLVLPDAPYQIDSRPISITGLFEACYLANALVHPGYDGEHDWVATVGLVSLPAGTDTDRLARTTLAGVHQHFFGGHDVTDQTLHTWTTQLEGHDVMMLTQDVGYRIPHLPSTGDQITLQIVTVASGRHVAALSVVPHDAPAELRAAAAASLASMRMG